MGSVQGMLGMSATRKRSAMVTIDARCTCRYCAKEEGTYTMDAYCANCGSRGITIVYRRGQLCTSKRDCPVCGCWSCVQPLRLSEPEATP